MGFHIETSEMTEALEHYIELSTKAKGQLDDAKNGMNAIITSQAMFGEVGEVIASDINNNKNAIIVGLKDTYTMSSGSYAQTYSEFQTTTKETSGDAVLDEDVLTKAKTTIEQFQETYTKRRQSIQSIYDTISSQISLSLPSSSDFTTACEDSKNELTKIITNVGTFESGAPEDTVTTLLSALTQQIMNADAASQLSYTDPQFQAFASDSEFSDVIQQMDDEIKAMEKKAAEDAKKEQELWEKRHPLESAVKGATDKIGSCWNKVVEGTKNSSLPTPVKTLFLLAESIVGGIGDDLSSLAVGSSALLHLLDEYTVRSYNEHAGIETPSWILDDISGAEANVNAMTQGAKKVAGNLFTLWKAKQFPQLLVDAKTQAAAKDMFDLYSSILSPVIDAAKNGDAYALGGYTFDVVSMFVGVGEVKGVLTGSKLLTKGGGLLKKGTKALTFGKLEKAAAIFTKVAQRGDDILKAVVSKLKKIPLPATELVVDSATGAVMRVPSGTTVGDLLKGVQSKFSKGGGAWDDGLGKVSGANTAKIKRTPSELDDLARDPSHGGNITKGSELERDIGLALEERGDLGHIIRDKTTDGGAEFIDTVTGKKYDVKSFVSYPNGHTSPKKGAFTVERAMENIMKELDRGYDLIINTTNLTLEHRAMLIDELTNKGLIDKIIFYP